MIRGKTKSGFKYVVDEKAIANDRRFQIVLKKSNSRDLMERIEADVDFVTLLLGEEQEAALYDHVREENGVIPNDRVQAEILEIFKKAQEDKDVKN